MGAHVGPERAQELLNGDFGTEVRQERVGGLSAEFDSFSGAYIDGTPGEFALTELAYDMAETIAGMHWEYGVQVSNDGGESWHFAHGVTKTTLDPIKPCWWFRTEEEARDFAKFRAPKRGRAVRIVRRLVSDVEVVE